MEDLFIELSSKVPNLSYIKEIKSGKEATVHLVTDGLKLYALKIYRKNTKFASRLEYLNIASITDSRSRRAIKNKTRTGRNKLENIWTENEFTLMRDLNSVTKNVPEVYASTNDAIIMDYYGTESEPAPKLIDLELDKNRAEEVFVKLCRIVELLLDFGFVHGDLSAYNILYWEGEPIVIDFPQALDIGNNRNAFEKFNKDLENIERYFKKNVSENTIRNRFKTLKEKFLFKSTFG